MARTFKLNTESFEKTTRTKRYGTSRKLEKVNTIRERRKQNRKLAEVFQKMNDYEPTD